MTVKDGGHLPCDTVQFFMWMSDRRELLPPSWVCRSFTAWRQSYRVPQTTTLQPFVSQVRSIWT